MEWLNSVPVSLVKLTQTVEIVGEDQYSSRQKVFARGTPDEIEQEITRLRRDHVNNVTFRTRRVVSITHHLPF